MCILDDIQEQFLDSLNDSIDLEKEKLSINNCDYKICIEQSAIQPIDEVLMKRVTTFCEKFIFPYESNSNRIVIFIKMKKFLHWHRLIYALCQCIRIKGNADSFAIIKIYKGNNITEGDKPLYEDYVTPGNTLDILKLEEFISEVMN